MYSYQKILENSQKYHKFVMKKEFCDMCGICPHTATKILKSGRLPFRKIVNHRLHFSEISVEDILRYVKAECRLSICTEVELEAVKEYYINKYTDVQDILSTPDIRKLIGYGKETVRKWIIKGDLPAVKRREQFYISKDDLINFLCTERYMGIIRKSKIHIEDEDNIKSILK